MVRLHQSSWKLVIRCLFVWRCYADSTQCSHPCTGTNFMCRYNVVRQLRYYFITAPSLFISSDRIISRILQQTKLIDTIKFVNYHHWSVARRYMSLGSHAIHGSRMTSIIMHILHVIDLSMFSNVIYLWHMLSYRSIHWSNQLRRYIKDHQPTANIEFYG
jgi:hypothetical protein